MNFAHLHLLTNHIPVIGLPIAAIFLAYGFKINNSVLQKAALVAVVVLSLSVLAVFFSGEPAEDAIINRPEISERYIESHEEAAEIALILTLASGVSAVFALWQMRGPRKNPMAVLSTLVLLLGAVVCLGYAANLGGQIRHPEIRPPGERINS